MIPRTKKDLENGIAGDPYRAIDFVESVQRFQTRLGELEMAKMVFEEIHGIPYGEDKTELIKQIITTQKSPVAAPPPEPAPPPPVAAPPLSVNFVQCSAFEDGHARQQCKNRATGKGQFPNYCGPHAGAASRKQAQNAMKG